jgi:hypothetical protein
VLGRTMSRLGERSPPRVSEAAISSSHPVAARDGLLRVNWRWPRPARPSSPNSNDWSASPRLALPRQNASRRFLHAPYCVPSWVVVCAQLTGHGSIRLGGAALRFSRTFDDLSHANPESITGLPTSTFGSTVIRSCQSIVRLPLSVGATDTSACTRSSSAPSRNAYNPPSHPFRYNRASRTARDFFSDSPLDSTPFEGNVFLSSGRSLTNLIRGTS